MAREDLHFRLRIPEALKARVEMAATDNHRSMTAEIVARLEASFAFESPPEGKLADRAMWVLPDGVYVDDLARAIEEAHKQAVEVAIRRIGVTVRPPQDGDPRPLPEDDR